MAFTMHSHSGQFCPGHAKDQLEEILEHAISIGYKTIGLTEHMPRYEERDLYPEEASSILFLVEALPYPLFCAIEHIPLVAALHTISWLIPLAYTSFQRDDPKASLAELPVRHEAYLAEAQRLQKTYAERLHILIGFEAEFIRPEFGPLVLALAEHPIIDYFIGSVHHVHSIPIDLDKETYARARNLSGAGSENPGTEERMYEDYYDLQFQMLQALRPQVVGHFDLIRLMSEDPERDVRQWKGVWERIMRNLKLVAEQGGWLECNSAGLRKGLAEPYPGRLISEEWLKLGGKFTFSDDSHGIAQVATNYARTVKYLESLGVEEVWTLQRKPHPGLEGNSRATVETISVPLATFRENFNE